MKTERHIETPRLLLRKPRPEDAEAIFGGWASDPVATRYLSWSTHRSLADTASFLRWSDGQWQQWPIGPLLVERPDTGEIVGSSGLTFETGERAEIGYVFARAAWGRGYATETVRALLGVAARLASPLTLFAHVHAENAASRRVLQKCGFTEERLTSARACFPNSDADGLVDVVRYSHRVP